MTSQLIENVEDVLTDTIALMYTQGNGVFDDYLFTLLLNSKEQDTVSIIEKLYGYAVNYTLNGH